VYYAFFTIIFIYGFEKCVVFSSNFARFLKEMRYTEGLKLLKLTVYVYVCSGVAGGR